MRFVVDGEAVGDPVAVSDGSATLELLPARAGDRTVTASFEPSTPAAVATAETTALLAVGRAPTATELVVAAGG